MKYRDIKEVYNWYNKFADDKAKKLIGTQPSIHMIGYYMPRGANWSYRLGILQFEWDFYEVVTVFGAIRAVRLINIPKYDENSLEDRRY